VIDDAFVYVSDACLSSVRVHYENKSDIMKSSQNATSRTGSHVAKNLSAVNAYPIESGMRKDVALGPNVNWKASNKAAERTCYSCRRNIQDPSHKEEFSNIPW
jgi:hypothetical protein